MIGCSPDQLPQHRHAPPLLVPGLQPQRVGEQLLGRGVVQGVQHAGREHRLGVQLRVGVVAGEQPHEGGPQAGHEGHVSAVGAEVARHLAVLPHGAVLGLLGPVTAVERALGRAALEHAPQLCVVRGQDAECVQQPRDPRKGREARVVVEHRGRSQPPARRGHRPVAERVGLHVRGGDEVEPDYCERLVHAELAVPRPLPRPRHQLS